jgi:hypothetical protein
MAEWQYRIERIELTPEAIDDAQFERILQEHGKLGWELVQVLQGQETRDNPTCRLIFKTQKPLD